MNDTELEKLWEAFGDIPIDEEECIDTDFAQWEKGTDRFDIWHWFDENHSKGIKYLMPGIGRRAHV